MRIRICWLAIFVALLCGCQRDISGTYLASDKTTVLWLQIVRTPDNHLTGQMAYSVLGEDGKIKQDSNPIEGAINGADFTISFSGKTFGGKFDDNKVTLTGQDPTPLIFKRADMGAYQKLLADLNIQSQNLLVAKQAEANREKNAQILRASLSEIDHLLGDMERFDTEANLHIGRLPNGEKYLQEITAKISGYVSRERELAKKPNTSVDRSQLVVAEYQTALNTNQTHFSEQSLASAVTAETKRLADESVHYQHMCSLPVAPGTLTDSQVAQRDDACKRLVAADSNFRQKHDALASGLSHFEQVYEQENKAQQELIHVGEKLQD